MTLFGHGTQWEEREPLMTNCAHSSHELALISGGNESRLVGKLQQDPVAVHRSRNGAKTR